MIEKIKTEIAGLLREAGVTTPLELTTPPKPELGDFAFSCFGIAKELKIDPVEAAKELESRIGNGESGIIQKTQAFGPYINFFVDGIKLAELVLPECVSFLLSFSECLSGL